MGGQPIRSAPLLEGADQADLARPHRFPADLNERKGFPHGMPTIQAETINADLLAFLQS